jgi:hypothetical protein
MKTTVRFFRHHGICRPMFSCGKSLDRSTAFRPGSAQTVKDAPEVPRPTHRRDEFRPAIPQRVARQQSPSPLHRHAHPKTVPGSATMNFQRTVNSVLTVCLSLGDHPSQAGRCARENKPAKLLLHTPHAQSGACEQSDDDHHTG